MSLIIFCSQGLIVINIFINRPGNVTFHDYRQLSCLIDMESTPLGPIIFTNTHFAQQIFNTQKYKGAEEVLKHQDNFRVLGSLIAHTAFMVNSR